jgi:hypothetical protein
MIAGLLIIIVFPFIYFYTQMNNFNQKTDIIRTAINEGKETYIDPLTGKMHWTENGAVVSRIKLNMFWKPGDQNSLPGDEVLIDLNTDKIYRNYSREKFIAHVEKQIEQGKCWCGARKEFRDRGYLKDEYLKYHIKGLYFYRLMIDKISKPIYNRKEKNGAYEITLYCYQQIYNPATKKYGDKKEIGYQEYKKLGGKYEAQDFIIRHIE